MTKRSLQQLLTLSILTPAALLALSARADLQERKDARQESRDDRRKGDDDDRGKSDDDDRYKHRRLQQLPSGQFISPTAIDDAVQQYLNPGLLEHPNFVAGQALRSQLSPDGTTLAIICAGQNSLFMASGTAVDVANSTQYIFLYDVAGSNKHKPVLSQVIKQQNAHVGLVFSPDGNTLYAAGGADDAVYVYVKTGGTWVPGFPALIALGHANRGVGLFKRQAQRCRHRHLRRRLDAGRRQQLQRLDQRDRHRKPYRPIRARSAPVFRQQRG